jgi:hypothetical protein
MVEEVNDNRQVSHHHSDTHIDDEYVIRLLYSNNTNLVPIE